MVSNVVKAWERMWFVESDAFHYGVLRLGLLGWFCYQECTSTDRILRKIGNLPLDLITPSFATSLLWPAPAQVVPYIAYIQAASIMTAGLAALGLFTRTATASYAYLFLLKNGLLNSFGSFNHATSLPAVVFVILAVAPGVKRLSLDSLIDTHIRRRPVMHTTANPIWPARAIILFLALIYAAAGLSKLRHSGVAWMNGKPLAFSLSEQRGAYFTVRPGTRDDEKWRDGIGLEAFVYDGGRNTTLARGVARYTWLTAAGAVSTIVFEFTFFIALVSRRWMYACFLAAAIWHVTVGMTMGLNFLGVYWPIWLLVVNWDAVAVRFRSCQAGKSLLQ